MRLLAMPPQQPVQRLFLPNRQFSRLDSRVINPQQRIHIVHRLRAYIGQLLDLRSRILDLLVRHRQLQLLHTGLDGIPARETVSVPTSERD